MVYQDIILEKEDGVAIITMNRPEKLNALNIMMIKEIPQAVEEVRRDDDIRVLILTGAGRGFCSGGDVGRLADRLAEEFVVTSRRKALEPMGSSYALALARLEKPTIAAVNGMTAGAGLSLALLCDIRIASENAKFGAIWLRRGLPPDVGCTYTLPRVVGTSKALELIFTTDIIDAREAERIGLVSRVVPHDELMPVTKELAARIAKGPPIAIELSKMAVYKGLQGTLESALDYESYGFNICRASEDYKEGLQSFLEKREPIFKGR